jgi:hypothetical protein
VIASNLGRLRSRIDTVIHCAAEVPSSAAERLKTLPLVSRGDHWHG